jgi:hypothetical protein
MEMGKVTHSAVACMDSRIKSANDDIVFKIPFLSSLPGLTRQSMRSELSTGPLPERG